MHTRSFFLEFFQFFFLFFWCQSFLFVFLFVFSIFNLKKRVFSSANFAKIIFDVLCFFFCYFDAVTMKPTIKTRYLFNKNRTYHCQQGKKHLKQPWPNDWNSTFILIMLTSLYRELHDNHLYLEVLNKQQIYKHRKNQTSGRKIEKWSTHQNK